MSFILVVEDNPANMELVTTLLEEEGHECITAGDGAAGLSLATERLPDLILMDVSLPLINGLDATGILKRESRTRDIPIIALTAHAMRGTKEQCLQAGCNDYETKPLNGDRLMGKISKHVEARPPEFVRLLQQNRRQAAQAVTFDPYKQQAEEAEQKLTVLAEALAAAKEQQARSSTEYKERLSYLHNKVSASMSTLKETLAETEKERNALRSQVAGAAQGRERLLEEIDMLQKTRAAALARISEADDALNTQKAATESAETALAEHKAATEAAMASQQSALEAAEAALAEHATAQPTADAVDPEALEALRAEHDAAIAALEAAHTKALKSARRESTRSRKLAAEKRLQAVQTELTEAARREQVALQELAELRRTQSSMPLESQLLQAELMRKNQQLDHARSALAHLQDAVRGAVDASFREAMFGGSSVSLSAVTNK